MERYTHAHRICPVFQGDGSQSLDLQRDALTAAGVGHDRIFEDRASGKRDDRPGLDACLKSLRNEDTLVVRKLDRLGRDLAHLVAIVRSLDERGVGFRVLTGQGAEIDTSTPSGRLIFGIFASLAEFACDLIRERANAGLAAARARGRRGGARYKMTPAKLRLAMVAKGKPEVRIRDLCKELGISSQTFYRHVSPDGQLRPDGAKLLERVGR